MTLRRILRKDSNCALKNESIHKNNRDLNAITTIASHEGIQPKSIARIINDQDIYDDKYTPVSFVASVERYFTRFPELTDEQYEKFFAWVGPKFRFNLQMHHPLPKFLLGDAKQFFVPLPNWWHQGEYHGLLGNILKEKGISYPTISSSWTEWQNEFQANPDLQLETYDAVLEAARIMEAKYPPLTGFSSYIWESVVNDRFKCFYPRVP